MLGQEGGQVVIGWVITLWGLIGCFLGFAALRLLVVRGTLAVLWCLVVQLVKSPVAVEKGTKAVISVNFSVYGLRTFNNLRTNFAVEIP